MSTQNALLVTKIGSPLTLTTTHPIPQPSSGQIQLKVTVAGLNPHDAKCRDTGLFIAETLPAILSNDVVGTVSALGPGVTKYALGDRVVSHAAILNFSHSGLQQYALADVAFSAAIPEGTSDDEAATLPTNIIAPLIALFDALEIPAPWTEAASGFDYAGATLLVVGGGSNCGRFGVQLAKLAGIGKIVVVGGKEEELKGYGATQVLDRHGGYEVVLERIRGAVGDELVYAYDAVNPPEGQILALNALSSHKKGSLARLLPMGPVDESKVLGKKAGFEVRNVFGVSAAKPELCEPFWERVPEYLEKKQIKPLTFAVVDGLDADKVNEAIDGYTNGKPTAQPHIHI